MPKPPGPDSLFWKAWEGLTRVNVALFRATRGRIGGSMGKTARVLLLHHTGRKSGKARVSPLIFLEDGANLVVVASKGGVDAHPAWFHNVMAMDATEVELPGGGARRPVRARMAEGAERDRLWPRLVGIYKPYADYATYTDRQIPVVVLEPA
jgi:deazaflavin-dependent oxidoreductase (nitroreductase family)